MPWRPGAFIPVFPSVIFICLLFIAPMVAYGQGNRQPRADNGKAIAEKHCARCHVIGAYNRMGGIGSTASFQMIARMPDGMVRFQTFYARRPHPAFLTVPGIPRWSKALPYAAEFTITLDQVDDIVAFAKTLEKMPIIRNKRR